MIWLLSAAICSITIALILKVNEARGGNRILIAGANYLVASAISFALLVSRAGGTGGAGGGFGWNLARPGAGTLILGVIAGIVWVLGFLTLMAGIARGPLAVPVTVTRLSVAIPVVVSIAAWGEQPGPLQWLGIALGLAAVALFGLSLSGPSKVSAGGARYGALIACLFVVMGLGDVILKAFREISPDFDRLAFSWILFTVAAAFTWLLFRLRRVRFDARTFCLGLVLGVPNLFSTVFTLLALRTTPASIAFPFINLTVIAGSTLLGFAIWKERLRPLSLAGLLAATAAIVLLSWRSAP